MLKTYAFINYKVQKRYIGVSHQQNFILSVFFSPCTSVFSAVDVHWEALKMCTWAKWVTLSPRDAKGKEFLLIKIEHPKVIVSDVRIALGLTRETNFRERGKQRSRRLRFSEAYKLERAESDREWRRPVRKERRLR